MISSYLELLLIITTYLSYKLILRKILWFASNLFFYIRERLPPRLVWSVSKDTKISSMIAPEECYKPKNKRKCTERRWEMSGDLMEVNDTELNYINFGDETDSDDASNDSDEDFVFWKSLFYFKQFSIVRTSEGFLVRYILH